MGDEKREFKGIWIPRTVWLDSRLNALDKIILMEIDSLDNEDGCYASNEHLADFCQCSMSKVSKTISKLIECGYIYVDKFDGRKRFLRSSLANRDSQPSKIYQSAEQKLPESNIGSNTVIKKENSTTQHRYGEYKNVRLSDEDMAKLREEFPHDWQDRIERLSAYMASTGKTYKNHLATIRNWARRNGERPQSQTAKTSDSDYTSSGNTGWACFDEMD